MTKGIERNDDTKNVAAITETPKPSSSSATGIDSMRKISEQRSNDNIKDNSNNDSGIISDAIEGSCHGDKDVPSAALSFVASSEVSVVPY